MMYWMEGKAWISIVGGVGNGGCIINNVGDLVAEGRALAQQQCPE